MRVDDEEILTKVVFVDQREKNMKDVGRDTWDVRLKKEPKSGMEYGMV